MVVLRALTKFAIAPHMLQPGVYQLYLPRKYCPGGDGVKLGIYLKAEDEVCMYLPEYDDRTDPGGTVRPQQQICSLLNGEIQIPLWALTEDLKILCSQHFEMISPASGSSLSNVPGGRNRDSQYTQRKACGRLVVYKAGTMELQGFKNPSGEEWAVVEEEVEKKRKV